MPESEHHISVSTVAVDGYSIATSTFRMTKTCKLVYERVLGATLRIVETTEFTE